MTPASKICIIGIGNEFRGDDGAGLAVARLLRKQLPPAVCILEQSGEGTSLMDAWRGVDYATLIDAVQSGAAPGTIHRIDPAAGSVPTSLFPCSTHAFGVAEAIEMARALHELPPHLIVYGIEGADFAEVQSLSAEVGHAVDAVAARIVSELLAVP